MRRENFSDLVAFVMVAREGSFTRAAAKLGVSQSALSHTIRGIEARMGLRLLTRTTRSVSVTEAGARLLAIAGPRFDEIDAEMMALSELRDKPTGTVRITAAEHAANQVLWPKLIPLLASYPDIHIEINIDYAMTDIVANRYDLGVRLGDAVAKDMIAVRIGPDFRMVVVGAPSYFEARARPLTPHELTQHDCINLRLPTYGVLYPWEFEQHGHQVNVRVEGQLTFNSSSPRLRAALAGFGLALLPEDMVAADIAAGRLVSVLDDWCQSFPGYHIYYPSRQSSQALQLVIQALRYQP